MGPIRRLDVGEERAALNRQDGGITYRFHARDLHLVLGSGSGQPVRFKVMIDGKPPGDSHGVDVDAPTVMVSSPASGSIS